MLPDATRFGFGARAAGPSDTRAGLEVLCPCFCVWEAHGDPHPEDWVKVQDLARMGRSLDYWLTLISGSKARVLDGRPMTGTSAMAGVPDWLRLPLDRHAEQDRVREDEAIVALVGLGVLPGGRLDLRLELPRERRHVAPGPQAP